ncbi:hypothetical protein [Luteolibacter soli]|uniref:Cell division protein ZapA n=1 Tax=Luteolibacter soli TaxID=3135280 RepID=A0ABU9AU08_9BACT
MGCLSWQWAAAAEPTVDEILASVEKKVAPNVSNIGTVPEDPDLLVMQANERLNREIMASKDRKLRVIYAITCLNSAISYVEQSPASEKLQTDPDFERLKKFRAILAKEFIALSKKEAAPQPSK